MDPSWKAPGDLKTREKGAYHIHFLIFRWPHVFDSVKQKLIAEQSKKKVGSCEIFSLCQS